MALPQNILEGGIYFKNFNLGYFISNIFKLRYFQQTLKYMLENINK